MLRVDATRLTREAFSGATAHCGPIPSQAPWSPAFSRPGRHLLDEGRWGGFKPPYIRSRGAPGPLKPSGAPSMWGTAPTTAGRFEEFLTMIRIQVERRNPSRPTQPPIDLRTPTGRTLPY